MTPHPATQLVIFGSPKVGTALMTSDQRVGIELPTASKVLKLLGAADLVETLARDRGLAFSVEQPGCPGRCDHHRPVYALAEQGRLYVDVADVG